MTTAFISYSWDNDDHKMWVRDLATRLHGEGITVKLDQWHLVPGDQLPQFMETAVRKHGNTETQGQVLLFAILDSVVMFRHVQATEN